MNRMMKKIIIILSINLFLFIIAAIVLELIFGAWIHTDSLNRLNIVRNRTIKFNLNGLYPSDKPVVVYTRDKYGLRGSYHTPGDIDILTVGGSTTDQRYVSDGYTWQDILQERFQSIGKNIKIANAGVDGQSSLGHIRNFDWWFNNIPELKPKFIIFYLGINDFYKNERISYDELVTDSNKKSYRQILREKSALYHLMYTLHGIYSARVIHKAGHGRIDFSKVEWTTKGLQANYEKMMGNRLEEYEERLTVLISKTIGFGAIPIFVTQPTRRYRFDNGTIIGIKDTLNYNDIPINGVDYYQMIRKYDELTCSIGRKHDVLCLDLAKEKFWEDDDYYDFSHMTPKGAKKVGEYIFENLKDRME